MPKKKTAHPHGRVRARNPTTPRGCRAAVVGLDGIGRQITLLLTASRVRALLLVDHRIVTRRIQRAEGFDRDNVDRMKAHAAAQACHEIDPTLEVVSHTARSEPDLSRTDVVFVCGNPSGRGKGPSGEMARIQILCAASGRGVIRIECRRTEGRRADKSLSLKMNRILPEVTAIAAGLAVHEFKAWLAGDRTHRTHLLDLHGVVMRVSVRS